MKCEHDYEVLQNDIDIAELKSGDKTIERNIRGCAIFYCKKCLDIQIREIETRSD